MLIVSKFRVKTRGVEKEDSAVLIVQTLWKRKRMSCLPAVTTVFHLILQLPIEAC